MMSQPLWVRRLAGSVLWITALVGVVMAGRTVQGRLSRPVTHVAIEAPEWSPLRVGDAVFLSTDRGLEWAGEVSAQLDWNKYRLALHPERFARVRESTQVTIWRTPLSTGDALEALFPRNIQHAAAELIGRTIDEHDEHLQEIWGPLIRDLSASFLELVGDDVEAALRKREPQLLYIAEWHAKGFLDVWPGVQEQLRPIVQERLTPVLGRLVGQALSDAPKVSIAWNVARGKQEEAYRIMLDWLTEYLSNIPEKDRAELNEALRLVWDEASKNPQIVDPLAKVGRNVFEDQRLRDILTDVYREAVAENPKTIGFVQSEILDSPKIRRQFYALVDTFAPSAKQLSAMVLFDENGATRPEVAQLIRSVALNRQMAWVTLKVDGAVAAPVAEGALLKAVLAGGDG